MTDHTPGPWIACGWKNTVVNLPSPNGKDHYTICVYPGHPLASLEETQANARLIAAAPDMLETLKAIVALLDHAGVCSDTAPAYNLAMHTIAKATGH
jgi:hypothetical protein